MDETNDASVDDAGEALEQLTADAPAVPADDDGQQHQDSTPDEAAVDIAPADHGATPERKPRTRAKRVKPADTPPATVDGAHPDVEAGSSIAAPADPDVAPAVAGAAEPAVEAFDAVDSAAEPITEAAGETSDLIARTPDITEVPDASVAAADARPAHDDDTVDVDSDATVGAASDDGEESAGFDGLGLRPELMGALAALGYEEATPIQAEAIPVLIAGRDLVGQAATGTGKTAAFALPILHRLAPRAERGKHPTSLILVPTRELAVQVSEAIYKYGRELGVRVLPVYGGQPIQRQLKTLSEGVDVIVATPGRAIDHIERGSLDLARIATVVLDEADEMLDMGFAEDIERILSETSDERQTVLFSATMPPRINAISRQHLRSPERISIGRETLDDDGVRLVRETAYIVMRAHKPAALGRILDVEAPKAAIVFCRTRTEVDELTETMNGRGYRAEALHGGMGQDVREKVMGRLRAGVTELLLATDVAARGIDIGQLSHVVNYDVPSAAEAYVHRIGRVGRAGRQGVAITLAEPREQRLLANIERLTKHKITVERVPTVADLRARQFELTQQAIRDALVDDDLDEYASIVDALGDDLDLRSIALAGIKLVHIASGATTDAEEIPEVRVKPDRPKVDDRPRTPREDRPRASDGNVALLYIGLGTSHGVRPGDLVGAIANETDLVGSQIGPIKVAMYFSTVGVPASEAESVMEAMRATTLRGKKVTVRPFTDSPDESRGGRSERPPRRDGEWTPRRQEGEGTSDRPRREDGFERPNRDDSRGAPRPWTQSRDDRPTRDDRPPRDDRGTGERRPWSPAPDARPSRDDRPTRDDRGSGWSSPRDDRPARDTPRPWSPPRDRGDDRPSRSDWTPRDDRPRPGGPGRPSAGRPSRDDPAPREWSPKPEGRSGPRREGGWSPPAGRGPRPAGDRPSADNWVPREMRPASARPKPAGKGGYPRSGAPRPGGAPRSAKPGGFKGPKRDR